MASIKPDEYKSDEWVKFLRYINSREESPTRPNFGKNSIEGKCVLPQAFINSLDEYPNGIPPHLLAKLLEEYPHLAEMFD